MRSLSFQLDVTLACTYPASYWVHRANINTMLAQQELHVLVPHVWHSYCMLISWVLISWVHHHNLGITTALDKRFSTARTQALAT
jgi:hypothetical protein